MSTEVADESLLLDTLWSHWSESYMSVACQGPEHTSRPTPDFWGSQADNCGLCSTEPISRWKVSLYWWTSKSFCDKPLLNKHILNVPRHLWEFDSLGDILIFAGSTKKGRTEMNHLVLFHRPERSFKTDKVGSGELHLRNHHRNHVVYACTYALMHVCMGLHLGYLITSNGTLLNLQRPDYSWKEHKMI